MFLFRRSTLKKQVGEAVSQLKYDLAFELILQASKNINRPNDYNDFIFRSIHRILESILFDHSIEKIVSLYVRHSQILEIDTLLKEFHQWIVFVFKFSHSTAAIHNSIQSNSLSSICRLAIHSIHQSMNIWSQRLSTARILLLYRVILRFLDISLPVDSRTLVILLNGCLINLTNEFSSLTLQSILLFYLILQLENPSWQSAHLSSSNFHPLVKTNNFSLKWTDLCFLIRNTLKSPYTLHYQSLRDSIDSHLNNKSIILHQYHQSIQIGISNLYQVLTPRSIESLQDIWSHLSLYLDLSFHSSLFGSESLVALSLRINSFDSHHKPIFLQAITEAFKSPRPKYRHGAVLVKSVDEVIAVSRNESIKESKQLQRIRHAEIGCLIQVVDHQGQLPCLHKINDQKKRRLNNNDSSIYSIYIVEIDEYKIGYCDAQACPSCIAALIKSGIQYQLYTTPNGINLEFIKQHNPQIIAPTLDVVLSQVNLT